MVMLALSLALLNIVQVILTQIGWLRLDDWEIFQFKLVDLAISMLILTAIVVKVKLNDFGKNVIHALGFLMLEAARVGLTDTPDMSASDMMAEALAINDLGFDEAGKAAIAGHYAGNVRQLREIISTQKLTTPHYKDLEWRLDVQVASRSARQQVQPTFMLKLHTVKTPTPASN